MDSDDNYRVIQGKRTNNTPILAILSGAGHESGLLRHTKPDQNQIIICGTSAVPPSERAAYRYWDFTLAGEIFITEKCKMVLDRIAPEAFLYYPCRMNFMEPAEPFFIIKPAHRYDALDLSRIEIDDGDAMNLALHPDFYRDVPPESRRCFGLTSNYTWIPDLIAHVDVVNALITAEIGGFKAYAFDEWCSFIMFQDNDLLDPEPYGQSGMQTT